MKPSYDVFNGLDFNIFVSAAKYVLESGQCCCCPAIEAEIINRAKSRNLFKKKEAWEWRAVAEPYLLALAYVFKPDDIDQDDAWWDNDVRGGTFEVEPRVIALLLCAEFCREANG